jgi:predicted site-specific integrase-resolvase
MQEKFPKHTIISDIASGINFKRKGLKTILDLALKGKIQEVVVAHKDRLSRFGFELIEYILSASSNAKIVVLDKPCGSIEEEIVQDVLQILNVYTAKINGSRKYKHKDKENKDIPKPESKADA